MTGEQIVFADVESLQDLGTYVARARRLDEDGAIRLQAVRDVLAAWVCALPGRGLLLRGVVLGLRVMPLAPGHPELDVTVPLGGLTDRFARRERTGDVGVGIPVPPTRVALPWAALTPPRSGWAPVGELDSGVLLRAAREGVAAVAEGTPPGAGAHAVTALRERIWSAPLPGTGEGSGLPPVSAGAALAAYGLGFAREGERATVFQVGGWTRLTLPVGHVLTR